ncbi:general secretion pathway protein GspJ [Geomonas limicola]|uniref:Type II secretion system protein J n=1 Tax=Geomonas limicola TaxID=2740186 RepID=A0A6V8NCW1_9BACT|nr:type II secretion system protein GspJ [Geomonas limicola]GFO69373.1 general secretion pathway protein GspJ [Geomonas limicola]
MLDNKGFTLIELLVALALLVILTGALYGTYFSVTAARERGGQRMESRREISATLGGLHNEIASAFFKQGSGPAPSKPGSTPGSSTGGSTSSGSNSNLPSMLFVVEDRDSFGKPASTLAFTYLAPPRLTSAPTSDLTLVSYTVKEKDGVLTLRREARDPYLETTVKSTPYPVIEVIEGFQVECYDGSKWVKTWDTALNNRIPKTVRVTITLKGGEVFRTVASPGYQP